MFDTLHRSWEFAVVSYRILWDHKQLIIFPILSTAAAILVSLSFILPLWGTGTLEQWEQIIDGEGAAGDAMLYIVLFLFYFANYFVIVFFNSALAACAMQVIAGEPARIGYGLQMATKRLPQILAWAFVSAVIGVGLRALENAHKRAGQIIAAILGTAWTALTYFVVPVIVMEGKNPIDAIKGSIVTLKSTWGTALVGNFSLGVLSFLVALPAILIGAAVLFLGFQSGSTAMIVGGIALIIFLLVIVGAVSSAADMIFKVVLYHWATGRMIPEAIDTTSFEAAFQSREP